MIITLLTIIAVTEVTRLFLTHRGVSKKAHFKQKLDGVKRMICDMEFKVFKTKEIREGVRKEYDHMSARIDALKTQISNFEGKEEDKKTIEDQKTISERDAEKIKNQLLSLDVEIYGQKPTNDNPEGISGITEQIGSLRELHQMLKDWIAKL